MANSDGKILVYEWMNPNKIKNFGDLMSKDIIEYNTGKKVVVTDEANAELLAVGSVMDNIEKRYPKLKGVWGSGFITVGENHEQLNHLMISLVRGKLSRSRIGGRDVPLGDPGLLAPLVYKRGKKNGTFTIGIVPHYKDLANSIFQEFGNNNMFQIIDVRRDPRDVIADITSKDLILSSSLHGLIISDAFNIPNYWIDSSDVVEGNGYKFEDYFSSVGRIKENVKITDVNQLTEEDCHGLVLNWKPVENLTHIQENIMSTFPFKTFDVQDKSILVTDLGKLELPSKEVKIIKLFQGENFFDCVDFTTYEKNLNSMGFQKVAKDDYLVTFRRGTVLLRVFYIKNKSWKIMKPILGKVYRRTLGKLV